MPMLKLMVINKSYLDNVCHVKQVNATTFTGPILLLYLYPVCFESEQGFVCFLEKIITCKNITQIMR